jgi:hypothetical protein
MTYDIRTYVWYNGLRPWAVFMDHPVGVSSCLYTAATQRQCIDWLRTMTHQRRLPKGDSK